MRRLWGVVSVLALCCLGGFAMAAAPTIDALRTGSSPAPVGAREVGFGDVLPQAVWWTGATRIIGPTPSGTYTKKVTVSYFGVEVCAPGGLACVTLFEMGGPYVLKWQKYVEKEQWEICE